MQDYTIDKHIVLTLDRSERRHWASLGASAAMGIPLDKICFFLGHDNKTFDDDSAAIAYAANEDGFPFVKNFSYKIRTNFVRQTAASAAQFWNYARILRYIAASGQICSISWDDRCFRIPFHILDGMTKYLVDIDDQFYLLQLRIRSYENLKYIAPNHRLPSGDIDKERKEFMDIINTENIDNIMDNCIQRDMLGYDEMCVFSPKGAAWMLYDMFEMEDLGDLTGLHLTGDANSEEERKYRSRINIDDWIAWGIRDSIDIALDKGKGLYCPKKKGYSMIEDWLPMGTDIDWKPEDAEDYDLIHKDTKIPFVEVD